MVFAKVIIMGLSILRTACNLHSTSTAQLYSLKVLLKKLLANIK